MWKEPVVLEDQGHRPLARRHVHSRRDVVQRGLAEPDRAGAQRCQTGDRAQQGRLAGAVGSKDGENLARSDSDRDLEGEARVGDPAVDVQRRRGAGWSAHVSEPGRSHRSRSPTRTATATVRSTRDKAIAASGSDSKAT